MFTKIWKRIGWTITMKVESPQEMYNRTVEFFKRLRLQQGQFNCISLGTHQLHTVIFFS